MASPSSCASTLDGRLTTLSAPFSLVRWTSRSSRRPTPTSVPRPKVADEARDRDRIRRCGTRSTARPRGISLGDLKEALQKAWMPQNTVKGMRLHRYVAHFPRTLTSPAPRRSARRSTRLASTPAHPQPSPPPARSAVVPSAAAIAANAAASPPPARSTVVPSAAAMAAHGGRRRARARATTAHRRGQGQGGLPLLTADEKFAAKKLGYTRRRGRGARAGGDDAAVGDAALQAARGGALSRLRQSGVDAEVVALEEAEAEAAAVAVAAKAAAAAEAAAEADAETGPTTATRHCPRSTCAHRRRGTTAARATAQPPTSCYASAATTARRTGASCARRSSCAARSHSASSRRARVNSPSSPSAACRARRRPTASSARRRRRSRRRCAFSPTLSPTAAPSCG